MDADRLNEVSFAQADDVDAVKALCDSSRADVGFHTRGSLVNAVQRNEVLVCRRGSRVLGAAIFHHRLDGQTTLYTIVTSPDHRRRGVGTALIRALLSVCADRGAGVLRLRCPEDAPANEFYRAMGFSYAGTEPGRQRPLTVWEKRVR